MIRGVSFTRQKARSPYAENKARPLNSKEKKFNDEADICLNCTKPKCKGYCEKFRSNGKK